MQVRKRVEQDKKSEVQYIEKTKRVYLILLCLVSAILILPVVFNQLPQWIIPVLALPALIFSFIYYNKVSSVHRKNYE